MIRLFCKSYIYRLKNFFILLFILVGLNLLFSFIAYKNLSLSFAVQKSYLNYDYDYGYVLNYNGDAGEEYIYPDTNIEFFLDSSGKTKIIATSLMLKKDINYSNNLFNYESIKKDHTICIPKNIASTYHLSIGDTIYANYSYNNNLTSLSIASVDGYLYDVSDNSVINEVGMLCLPYDDDYVNNIKTKYIAFSKQSLADKYADKPQIISDTFNRKSFIQESKQLLLIGYILLSVSIISGIIFYFLMFGKTTNKRMLNLTKKGIKQRTIVLFNIIESFTLYSVPELISFCVLCAILFGFSSSYYLFVWPIACSVLLLNLIYNLIISFRRRVL